MLGKNRTRLWYLLGALGAALSSSTCTDATTGPGRSARLSFLPVFTPAAIQAFANLEVFGFGVDNVRLRLFHADGSLAKDTTVTLAPGQDSIAIEIDVPLNAPLEIFRAEVELRDGTTVLFSGTQNIPTAPGASAPPAVTLDYSGPGATATSLTLGPADTAMFASDSITFRPSATDANGQAVTNIALAWSVKHDALGTVDVNGKFKAAGARGSTYVIARLLTGVKDSAKVSIVPRATKLVLISGGGQTGTAGSALPQAIVVEAQAEDNLPVPGTPLSVQATAGAGSVGAANPVTDANGRASIVLTLGAAAGQNLVVVAGAGSPLIVGATGTAGGARKLAMTQQPSGNAASGTPFATQPKVQLQDTHGNVVRVANIGITAALTTPTSQALDGPLTVNTDANGLATFADLRIMGPPGTATLTFTQDTMTSAVSSSIVVSSGPPVALLATDSSLVSDTVRSQVGAAVLPSATVTDVSGNGIAGVAVKIFGRGKPGAQLTGPAGSGDTITIATDAQGIAKLTGRRLPQVTGPDTVFMVAAGIGDTVRFVASVTAGNAHHMVYSAQPPAQVLSATNFSVVVGFRDQFENPLLSSTKTIALQLKPATGNPSGTLSSSDPLAKVASGGSASFAASVDLVGAGYVVQAVSSGLPTLETTPFEIQLGPVAQVVVHSGTEGQGALKGDTIVIKARAMDAGGNDVNNAPMIFAVQSGGGNVNGQTADTVNAASTGQATGQVDWNVGTSGVQVARVTVNGHTLDFHAFLAETLVVVQQPPTTTQSGTVLAQQPIVQLRDLLGNQAKVSGVVLYSYFVGSLSAFATPQSATTDANGNASWTAMKLSGFIQTGQLLFQLPPCDCAGPPSIKSGKSADVSILAGTANDIESADDTTFFFLNAAGTVPIHIKATDGFNPIANSGVRFARTAGGQYCTLAAADSVVMTNGSGIATMNVQVAAGYASCVVEATMTNPPAPPPCSGECLVLAPPSVTNRFFDAPAGTNIWLAGGYPTFGSAYWADWYNWSAQVIPTEASTVYIPVAAYHAPRVTGTLQKAKHVYADNGTRIDTDDSDVVLNVYGDFVVDTVANAGRVWLSPDGSTYGALKATRIEGNLKLGTGTSFSSCAAADSTYLTGNVSVGTPGGTIDVDLRCRLDVRNFSLTAANDFVVSEPGRLIMKQSTAQVTVGGNGSFNGNAYLSAGTLELKKNFSTGGDCETRLFRASGTHVLRMSSATTDSVYMNSDCFPEFATLEIATAGPVGYNSANIVYSVEAKKVLIKSGAKWGISSNTYFTILFGGSLEVDSGGMFRRFGTFFVGSCTISLDLGPDFPGPFSCSGYSPS